MLRRRASGTRWRPRTGPPARAPTPAVSAPASGCPPTKRWSSPRVGQRRRLVEPTSLTTQSGRRSASASRDRLRERADRRRRRTRPAASATAAARSGAASSMAPRSSAARAAPRVGVEAADARARARARGQPDRAADQPDAEDRDPHAGAHRLQARAAGDHHDGAERLARERRGALDRGGVLGEVSVGSACGPSQMRLVGVGVHLDDDPVRAGRGGRERQRRAPGRAGPPRGSGRRSPAGARAP